MSALVISVVSFWVNNISQPDRVLYNLIWTFLYLLMTTSNIIDCLEASFGYWVGNRWHLWVRRILEYGRKNRNIENSERVKKYVSSKIWKLVKREKMEHVNKSENEMESVKTQTTAEGHMTKRIYLCFSEPLHWFIYLTGHRCQDPPLLVPASSYSPSSSSLPSIFLGFFFPSSPLPFRLCFI